MTQEELALRSGVARNVLIDVEHGKRGILYERLIDLAEALEVLPEELFKGAPSEDQVLRQHCGGPTSDASQFTLTCEIGCGNGVRHPHSPLRHRIITRS